MTCFDKIHIILNLESSLTITPTRRTVVDLLFDGQRLRDGSKFGSPTVASLKELKKSVHQPPGSKLISILQPSAEWSFLGFDPHYIASSSSAPLPSHGATDSMLSPPHPSSSAVSSSLSPPNPTLISGSSSSSKIKPPQGTIDETSKARERIQSSKSPSMPLSGVPDSSSSASSSSSSSSSQSSSLKSKLKLPKIKKKKTSSDKIADSDDLPTTWLLIAVCFYVPSDIVTNYS